MNQNPVVYNLISKKDSMQLPKLKMWKDSAICKKLEEQIVSELQHRAKVLSHPSFLHIFLQTLEFPRSESTKRFQRRQSIDKNQIIILSKIYIRQTVSDTQSQTLCLMMLLFLSYVLNNSKFIENIFFILLNKNFMLKKYWTYFILDLCDI